MRDYRSKEVMGYIGSVKDEDVDNLNVAQCKVRVRMTSDEHGQNLSLTAEDPRAMIQIGIPLEPVRDIIRVYNDRGGGYGKK